MVDMFYGAHVSCTKFNSTVSIGNALQKKGGECSSKMSSKNFRINCATKLDLAADDVC